jgi:hypothetical protein
MWVRITTNGTPKVRWVNDKGLPHRIRTWAASRNLDLTVEEIKGGTSHGPMGHRSKP